VPGTRPGNVDHHRGIDNNGYCHDNDGYCHDNDGDFDVDHQRRVANQTDGARAA